MSALCAAAAFVATIGHHRSGAAFEAPAWSMLRLMQVEHSIVVNAPPQRLFAIYADVANWHRWDPDTKAAHLNGPFQVGASGSLTPAKGNTVPMVITSIEPDRSFTAESRIPLFCMRFDHELRPEHGATRVVHRVTFSGALTFLLGRIIGAQVNKGLPVTLANLKALAEAGARGA